MSRATKRKYHAFSEDLLDKVVKDINENNLTYRQGEDKYGIPKSTLARWCTNKQTKRVIDSKGIEDKRFLQNKPGNKRDRSFLKRQKDDLKARFCHNINRARASLTPELMNGYFRELQESIADVPPQDLLNYDETSMQHNCRKNSVEPASVRKKLETLQNLVPP